MRINLDDFKSKMRERCKAVVSVHHGLNNSIYEIWAGGQLQATFSSLRFGSIGAPAQADQFQRIWNDSLGRVMA